MKNHEVDLSADIVGLLRQFEADQRAAAKELKRQETTRFQAMYDRLLQRQRLAYRITNYLSAGGLFNPEMMDHDAVRKLLLDCREYLQSE